MMVRPTLTPISSSVPSHTTQNVYLHIRAEVLTDFELWLRMLQLRPLHLLFITDFERRRTNSESS